MWGYGLFISLISSGSKNVALEIQVWLKRENLSALIIGKVKEQFNIQGDFDFEIY